ncbi:DUF6229 family protein [Jatrophihabitans sp.]|uniref:DUF6229 family protein n=1 Tax=Jatrophihabitans sp. TaxID=1932789 RepID=UPI002C55C0B9|nr:DUF6229 family protein [Jatrophihabitans sp.]
MSTALLTRPEALVDQWRTSADDNPAGPLFSTPFAEAELIGMDIIETRQGCSSCTASRTASCC